MGIRCFIFDEGATSLDGDYATWIRSQISAAPKGSWQRPEALSSALNNWFGEICREFPLLKDADPDDPHGSEYCFYPSVIDVIFAGSVGEEGVVTAWKLAAKYGLRIVVGDELLPAVAPTGERTTHISVLDGRKCSRKSDFGPNVCIVVLDTKFVPFGDKKQWVLEQLEMADWDVSASILETGPLKQWNDEFMLLGLESISLEMKFFRTFIFSRFKAKDIERVVPKAMMLSRKFHLPILFFENL